MAEKNLNEIPRDLRALYEKGGAALQRNNLDYAIAIFSQVLLKEPGFYDCRESLRAAQLKKSGGSTNLFKKVLGTASNSPMIAKGQMSLSKNPLDALAIAEQILCGDPNSTAAHKLLADAALAADLPRTALLSLEMLRRISPKDREVVMELALAYAKVGQTQKAEDIYIELLRLNPGDGEVNQAYKQMSAARTLKEGGYEALADGKGSYRDILKDKDQTLSLEQENRQVKSEEVAGKLIEEYLERLRQDPSNLKLARQVADLYCQKKEFDRALKYYQQLLGLDGGADATLERAITDTTLNKYDHALAQLDPQAADYPEQSATLKAEREAFLLADCQKRAEKYPNDLQIRFELGVLYFQAGKIAEAMPELQKAQQNPHRKIQAMGYLGQCFASRGMYDMAARTLQNAIKEKLIFDTEKKDLVYAFGSVLEKSGKAEEAIKQYEQIYEIDMGYKDVAAKVDGFYSGK
jgi:tetratricopeptide (TPR) repeat protein